jgi:putative transposase
MPRAARLDAPGILHHVMCRAIEGSLAFRAAADRNDFLERLAAEVAATGLQVLAWALLPNHLHLLVRTGRRPLSSVMRRILTGYAGACNRRHRRRGHLFQNRYRSIVVEEEPYLLELVRYIHLNPLRAALVQNLEELAAYPWSGHSALVGRVGRPWQATREVLELFSADPREGRRQYRAFVAAGAGRGRQPDLMGGGLRRSTAGWQVLADLRRGRERWTFDERVLGSGPFVERLLKEAELRIPLASASKAWQALPLVVARIAESFGAAPAEVSRGVRRRPAAHARAAVASVAVKGLGLPASQLAAALGVTAMVVLRGVERGLTYLEDIKLDPIKVAKEALEKV